MILRRFSIFDTVTCLPDGSSETPLNAEQLDFTFDNTWSIYGQGVLTCTTPSRELLAGVDPRNGLRTRFTVRQEDVDGPTYDRTFNVALYDRPRTASTDLVALGIKTNEALWADWASGTADLEDTSTAKTACVTAATRQGYVQNVDYFTINAAPDVDLNDHEADWAAGVNAWDYASQLAEVAGAWLYCDEQGIFRYAPSTYTADSAHALTLHDARDVKDVTDTISRGAQQWANYVIVEYTKDDPHKFAVASSGAALRKAVVVQRDRKKPANGNAAQTQLNSFLRRGRTLEIDAVADIRLRPNWTVTTTWRGETYTGLAQSVAYSFPTGTMRVLVNVTE